MTSPPPAGEAARRRLEWPPLPYAILGLLLVASVLTAGAAYVSPWFAFQAMRSAAAAGDVQGLDAVMDVSAVRASLEPQVDAYLPEEPPAEAPRPTTPEPRPRWLPEFVPWPLLEAPSSGPLERFTRPVTRPLRLRREVDGLVAPGSLAALSDGRAHVRDWGLQRFRISTVGGTPPRETIFTLQRRGWFDWEVVHVGLPRPIDDRSAAPPTAPPRHPRA